MAKTDDDKKLLEAEIEAQLKRGWISAPALADLLRAAELPRVAARVEAQGFWLATPPGAHGLR